MRDCEFGPTGSRKGGRYGTRCQKGNYDELVLKRGSHAVSRELRLLVPYGGCMRDDTWVDWKRATGRVEVCSARSPREGYHLVRRTDSKFDRGAVRYGTV